MMAPRDKAPSAGSKVGRHRPAASSRASRRPQAGQENNKAAGGHPAGDGHRSAPPSPKTRRPQAGQERQAVGGHRPTDEHIDLADGAADLAGGAEAALGPGPLLGLGLRDAIGALRFPAESRGGPLGYPGRSC